MRFAPWIIVVSLKLVEIEYVKVLKILAEKCDFSPFRLFLTASFKESLKDLVQKIAIFSKFDKIIKMDFFQIPLIRL